MTIIRPQKNKKLYNILIGFLSVIFAVVLFTGMWMYGNTVELKHDVAKLQEDIQREEARSSELKNSIYAILSPNNLENLAKERGLVKDRDPEYMQVQENQGITRI